MRDCTNMADVLLCRDDIDGPGDSSDLTIEDGQDDEILSPLASLQRYAESDNIFNRQMAARSVLDTLRVVQQSEEDYTEVINIMYKLSNDPEPTVRVELMDQLPYVAILCSESYGMPKCILPIVVKYLTDANNQVRKTSQQALLILLDHGLISKSELEDEVCPVIVHMSSPDSMDDFRTEAVTLMGKLAPVAGTDITELVFLPRFANMCTDAIFHVRKVCATSFGEICSVVSKEAAEEYLLPKFYYLCEDGVWGVRKACAECFMEVSSAVSPAVRRKELSPLFISLVCDQSRWVRMAAFQALGPFISTFADSKNVGFHLSEETGFLALKPDEEGIIDPTLDNSVNSPTDVDKKSIKDESENSETKTDDSVSVDSGAKFEENKLEGSEQQAVASESNVAEVTDNVVVASSNDSQITSQCDVTEDMEIEDVSVDANMQKSVVHVCSDSTISWEEERAKKTATKKINESDSIADKASDLPEQFSEFYYWRTPLPDVDLKLDSIEMPDTTDILTNLYKKEEEIEVNVSHSASLDLDLLERGDLTAGSSSESSTKEAEESSDVAVQSNASQTLDSLTSSLLSSLRVETSNSSKDGQRGGVGHVLVKAPLRKTCANTSSAVHIETPTNFFRDGVTGLDATKLSLSYIDESESDYSPINSPDKPQLDTDRNQAPNQEQIPQSLLDKFTSMTQISLAQTVDAEIAKHCAYSLPAVAYTLGRSNWSCLKETYETLASDMQWKVRRTLAFSIHELAVILGEEITAKDLVPVFNGFLKDLDEVRVGVLKHLYDFLKLLPAAQRKDYLPRIQEFLNTDNHRNWRFRWDLADQCIKLCSLYTASEINESLVPVALQLASDKVADVRCVAFRLLGIILRALREDERLVQGFVNDLIERFALSNRWNGRHTFAVLCQYLLYEDAISLERFAKDFLPSLLALNTDAVANVRMALARTLTQSIIPLEYMVSERNPHRDDILRVLETLKNDLDKDVKQYASLGPNSLTLYIPQGPV